MPHNRVVRLILLIATSLAVATPVEAQRPDGANSSRPQSYRDRDDWDERHRTPEAKKPSKKASKAKAMDGAAPLTAVKPISPPSKAQQLQQQMNEQRRRHLGQPSYPAAPASKSAKPMDGAAPLIAVKPIPTSPPSPAEQMQRRMDQERRNQRGEQASMDAGNFRCSAFPVCERSFGGYGSCRGVEQSYSARSWRDARHQIARDCAAANTPDPCDCAAQCSRVAQCGPI